MSTYLLIFSLWFSGLLSGTAQSQLTPNEVQEVYHNLVKYSGVPSVLPSNIVIDYGYKRSPCDNSRDKPPDHNNIFNACSYIDKNGYAQIHVFYGVFKYLHNKDELAALIGHEMSHIILDHVTGDINPDYPLGNQRLLESNADKFSIYLMMRAGYDPCAARNVWYRIMQQKGDNVLPYNHPAELERLWALDLYFCPHLNYR